MRIAAMLLVLSFAATCFADDPLESLNTVDDTVAAMQQALKAQAAEASGTKSADSLADAAAADTAAACETPPAVPRFRTSM